MNWYKKEQQEIQLKFQDECYDSHGGESFCGLIARDINTNEGLGYIDYSIFNNKLSIKMVEVKEEYKRMGIGTQLMQFLKKENPDKVIIKGMATEEGSSFVNSLQKKDIL